MQVKSEYYVNIDRAITAILLIVRELMITSFFLDQCFHSLLFAITAQNFHTSALFSPKEPLMFLL